MRLVAAFACAVMLLCLGASPGQAVKRVALVIGNSAYRNVPTLPNTKNDATDIAASFERLGFSITKVTDGTFDDTRRALLQFGRDARGSEMAVIFFAGHGMEIGGENWLIPVDAELGSDTDAENEAVSLKTVMLQVAGASSLGLVILDACRNNPFAAKMQRAMRTRAVDRGLVRTEPTDNVLVAYAAKDGTTAKDGEGRNSPFSAALLKNLETPGLEITFLFRNVRDDVMAATKREQQPFVYGSLSKQSIYLKAPTHAGAATTDRAAQVWTVIQNSTSQAVLEDFIRQFGSTEFGSMARARLDELKRIAAVVPPVVPAVPASPCRSDGATVASLSSRPACPLTAGEERALKPKDVFKECEKCPEMVVVPAGSFRMGSPANEPGRRDDEGPQHSVTIEKSFAVGKFHVTIDQFAAFVAETGYDAGSRCYAFEGGTFEEKQGRSWRNPGFAQNGSHPAVCLNWNDAAAYVRWLAKKTGKSYRLLTEAEWEYAARAGTTTRYSFGDDEKDLCSNGNGADQTLKNTIAVTGISTFAPCSDGYVYTSPGGSFAPNGFGLFDMHGNAVQWLEDCWNENYQGAPADGSVWTSGDCSRRALRGGSRNSGPKDLRAAHLNMVPTDTRDNDRGFRLARTL
jgi:formylglycine-generating enzyme required for sulfatase activity